MPVRYLLFVLLIAACGILQAGPCVTGTLLSYEALGATGCTVGELTANNFVFTLLGISGGAVAVTDTQIIVSPTFGGRLGLNFASTGFNVNGAGSVQYLIAYTWDPHDDIQSMDDIMDPPAATLGFANITTLGCVGAAFIGPNCSTSIAAVMVFDNNGVTQFTKSTNITPSQILGIRNTIDLEALGGSASFDSVGQEAQTPEPSTWVLCGAALAMLAARLRLRARLTI